MKKENTTNEGKTQAQLAGLGLKHRAQRLSALTGREFNAEYFAKIHNRSTSIIYRVWKGGAPLMRKKMEQHLEFLEDKYSRGNLCCTDNPECTGDCACSINT